MRLPALLLLSLAGLSLAGCDDELSRRPTAPQPRQVVAEPAVRQSYRPRIELTGEITARVQSDLSFRTGGRVIERRVDVGAHVRAGDVLARIDDSVQQADLEIARAKLAAAQATLEQKQLSHNRYDDLLKTRAISQATFDQAHEELVTAQGDVETAKANLATAEDTLSYTALTADADGVITARDIEVGQVVSAAQTAMTLAHDGGRDAVFSLFEAFFLRGAPQTEVDVSTIDRARTVRASIREVSPTIDSTTGTIKVKLTLPDNLDWPLGTPVVGTFLGPASDSIVLPWSAMASIGGTPAVWVIDPETRAVSARPVTLLRHEPGVFLVADGLQPGERVVTQGGQFLATGMIVAPEDR